MYSASTTDAGNEPSGLQKMEQVQPEAEIFYAESTDAVANGYQIPPIKDEKDSTEIPPKLEPLVLGGSGAVLLGVGAAVAGVVVAPVLFLAALVLLAGGAFLTAKGWKKIKAEPKKFKGEKLAIANYLIIGLVGLAASVYLVYWLFTI